jgi:hypothetical protein
VSFDTETYAQLAVEQHLGHAVEQGSNFIILSKRMLFVLSYHACPWAL